MGCYMDNASRDLEYVLYDEQWAVNSGRPKYEGFGVNRCVGACAAMGYMYAGKLIGHFKKLKCKKHRLYSKASKCIGEFRRSLLPAKDQILLDFMAFRRNSEKHLLPPCTKSKENNGSTAERDFRMRSFLMFPVPFDISV